MVQDLWSSFKSLSIQPLNPQGNITKEQVSKCGQSFVFASEHQQALPCHE